MFAASARVLTGLYALWPCYAGAVVLLTALIVGVLTPVSVRAGRSALAMRRLQPQIRELQARHRGDRERLNRELLALYQAERVSPFASLVPTLLQVPVFMVVFRLIRGLGARDPSGRPAPRYLDHGSRLYHDIVASNGHLASAGLDLAKRAIDVRSTALMPFVALATVLVMITRLQVRQRRDLFAAASTAAVTGPLATISDAWPYLFGAMALVMPGGLLLYYVASGSMRAGQNRLLARAERGRA